MIHLRAAHAAQSLGLPFMILRTDWTTALYVIDLGCTSCRVSPRSAQSVDESVRKCRLSWRLHVWPTLPATFLITCSERPMVSAWLRICAFICSLYNIAISLNESTGLAAGSQSSTVRRSLALTPGMLH